MKIIVDGKLFDATKTPILVVLDTADIQSVHDSTCSLPWEPLNFFQCPEADDGSEMEAIEKRWEERVRKYEEDERLQGRLPYTAIIPRGAADGFHKVLQNIAWLKCVDMKPGEHDYRFTLHADPDAKQLILEDLVVRDYGGTLLSGEDSDRPVLLPSGTVVEFRELDPKVWLDEKLDKVVESFRKSDAMAAFLDEILLRGMTCEHCGHKGLVRPEDGCIRHETVVGKDECPVHGKTIPEVYQDMLMEELSYHPFMQQMGEMRLLCACGEHRDSPIHHKPVTAPDGPSTVMGSSMQEARGLKIVALLLRQDMKEGEFYVDWRWYHERQGKVIVVRAHDGNNHEATINDVNAVGGGWQEVTLTVPEEMPLDRDCKWLGIQWASVKPEEGDGDAGEGQAPRSTA